MTDPAVRSAILAANAAEQAEAARQERMRETISAVQIALQNMAVAHVVEVPGECGIERLDRPVGEFTGGIILVFRAPGAPIAYRVILSGDGLDALHDRLHSPAPDAEVVTADA